jgi:hypothetical protein
MKVSELSGAQLDWAVAYIEGYAEGPNGSFWITEDDCVDFKPSSNWSQGGPIIERERITLDAIDCGETWIAQDYWKEFPAVEDSTPLVAAMRCYVFSELGDEVDLPVEIRDHKEGCPAIDGFGCKCEEIKNV